MLKIPLVSPLTKGRIPKESYTNSRYALTTISSQNGLIYDYELLTRPAPHFQPFSSQYIFTYRFLLYSAGSIEGCQSRVDSAYSQNYMSQSDNRTGHNHGLLY